ncbi:MAG: hypothetical protein CR960_01360, partial [Pasteurellales bacterium]
KDSVNIILGKNEIKNDGKSLLATALETDNGNETREVKPASVLDAKLVGSIQTGVINIHSTDSRSTVDAQNIDWNADTVNLKAGNVNIEGVLDEQTSSTNQPLRKVGYRALEASSSATKTQSYDKSDINADNVNINVSGDLSITGTDIDAKKAQLTGGSVDLSDAKSIRSHTTERNRINGYWNDSVKGERVEEKAHTTAINSDDLSIVATLGDVNAQAVQIDSDNVQLVAKQDVNLKGDTAKYKTTDIHKFKNAGRKLKTGSTLDGMEDDTYIPTSIKANKLVVAGGNDVTLTGVKADVKSLAVTGDNVNLDAQDSTKAHTKVHQETYWGRLFGASAEKDVRNTQVKNGTQLNVDGIALLNGKNGVNIKGSTVNSKGNGFVKSDANVNVESVKQVEEVTKGYRKGSLFDITKEADEKWNLTTNNHASNLRSDADLTVVTPKNINVVGSKLQAAGLVNVDAENVNVTAAQNTSQSTSHQVGKKDAVYDIKLGILNNKITVDNIIDNNIKFDPSISAGVGREFFDNSSETTHTSADASSITGGSVKLNADKAVTVAGSDVTATQGDLDILADQVVTTAVDDVTVETIDNTSVTSGVNAKVGLSHGVSLGTTLDIDNKKGTTTTTNAQSTSLTANNGTVNIDTRKTETTSTVLPGLGDDDDGEGEPQKGEVTTTTSIGDIYHEGTVIKGKNVKQNAETITQVAATSSTESDIDTIDVDLGLGVSSSWKGLIGGTATAQGSGDNTKKKETTANVTSITAIEQNTATATDSISDEGTNYQGADVTLTADKYDNVAASNTQTSTTNAGKFGVSLGASSSDPQSVKVEVGVNGGYQYENANGSQAVTSNINGSNSVNITAKKDVNTQASITGGDVTITGQNVNQTQASNTSDTTSGGFDADVTVGANVSVASGGMPTPSVDAAVSANGGNSESVTGVVNNITGNNVNITAQNDVNLEATNVDATNGVNLKGQKVTVSGTNDSSKDVSGSAGINVSASVG